ncbi:MAG: DUF4279 domain-containing protein [Oligoflexia bacterium]|nr:DUF4279 domain-containing protein [Oligoflexia bacterium]
MSDYKLKVGLYVLTYEKDYNEVTKILGVQPTRAKNKGEGICQNGNWSYDIDAEETLSKSIRKLFSELDDSKLKELLNTFEAVISVVLKSNDGAPEMFLDKDILKKIVDLGLEIDIDIYTAL